MGPTTRSAAARARRFDLLALPDDLLIAVARHALVADVPSMLRLLQACTALRARLGVLQAEANALRLCWVEEGMVTHAMSEDGLSLVRVTVRTRGSNPRPLPLTSSVTCLASAHHSRGARSNPVLAALIDAGHIHESWNRSVGIKGWCVGRFHANPARRDDFNQGFARASTLKLDSISQKCMTRMDQQGNCIRRKAPS